MEVVVDEWRRMTILNNYDVCSGFFCLVFGGGDGRLTWSSYTLNLILLLLVFVVVWLRRLLRPHVITCKMVMC